MRISDWSSDVCSSDLPTRSKRRASSASTSRFWRRVSDRSPARLSLMQPQRRAEQRHRDRGERDPAPRHEADIVDVAAAAAAPVGDLGDGEQRPRADTHRQHRSEEHTSELQSLMRISYAVFCLKKKKTLATTHI